MKLPLQTARFAALPSTFYSTVRPEGLTEPHLIAWNADLARAFGLPEHAPDADTLAYLAGNAPEYAPPALATVYSGHQFGGYTPRLGDGRALLLGEAQASDGLLWEWQLKGAGKTPYSRFADGRAVLRSSVREYLASEAVHALGIPTTRALALIGGRDIVYRESVETAAVLTRLAPSFIRFGHFEYFFYTGRRDELRQLADFVIDHHYPHCRVAENPYLALLENVAQRTADTVAAWQAVGFCHGVMNTDNLSILGLTIDYGPYGFMEAFDRRHICNHSDHNGRYAYHAQPYIAHWNLAALGNCFEDLVSEAELNTWIEAFPTVFQTAYTQKMRRKLGLQTEQAEDAALVENLWQALHGIDFTLFFRYLSELSSESSAPLPPRLAALLDEEKHTAMLDWLAQYRRRLQAEHCDDHARHEQMQQANPLYVLRNHLAQQAIEAAQGGDFSVIHRLQRCLAAPFDERAEFADLAEPAPVDAPKVCVSCSS